MDYYIVMLPGDKEKDGGGASEQLKKKTAQWGLRNAVAKKFPLPHFKVGTLDSLMECSDELAKLDVGAEGAIHKVLGTGELLYLETTDKSNIKKIRSELLTINVVERDQHGAQPVEKTKELKSYLENWKWDDFKYTDVSDVHIKKIIDDLQRPILVAEDLIKKRVAEYQEIKQKAIAAGKKVGGNLTVKDITQDVIAWNAARKQPIPEEILRRRAGSCDGTQLCMLFVALSRKDLEEWQNYATWGISEEQCHAMDNIKEGATDHASDSVSLSQIKFRCNGQEISVANATASNPGGSQTGFGSYADTGLAENLLDGSMETTWFDSNVRPVIIDFGKATQVDQYAFSTAKEHPHRDPVQWSLEGYTPAPEGTTIASVTIEVEGVGPITVSQSQSEHSVMMELHKVLKPPAGKRIYLQEQDGLKVSAVYDQLEDGQCYQYTLDELAGNEYSRKEETVDLGKWTQIHAMKNDFHTPSRRKEMTEFLTINRPGSYHKYRFTPTLMRGHPERGPIPCGNGAVPGTSEEVVSSEGYTLMSVMVFSQLEQSFRTLCRDHKIVVREYEPLAETGSRQKTPQAEYNALEEKRKEKRDALIRDVKTHFSEAYSAWIHIKAVRAFVEAILRYGLPTEYISCLFCCDNKNSKAHDEMRQKLAQHYSNLNPKGFDLGEDANEANALEERYAYVSLRIPNLIE